MANFYVYFISSLPMLHFEGLMPFTFARFLEMSRQFIPETDMRALENLPQPENYSGQAIDNQVIAQWASFDSALRNEIVKIRSSRRHIDASNYLRSSSYQDAYLAQIVSSSHRHPSLIESERILDQARWNFLDGLSSGHFFDLGFLIIYAYKLLILERWERARGADKEILLEAMLK